MKCSYPEFIPLLVAPLMCDAQISHQYLLSTRQSDRSFKGYVQVSLARNSQVFDLFIIEGSLPLCRVSLGLSEINKVLTLSRNSPASLYAYM